MSSYAIFLGICRHVLSGLPKSKNILKIEKKFIKQLKKQLDEIISANFLYIISLKVSLTAGRGRVLFIVKWSHWRSFWINARIIVVIQA